MVKLQIDLSEEEDKIVSIHKVENKLETKEQAVKEIIIKSKDCNHKYELVEIIKDKFGEGRKIIQKCGCGKIKFDKISLSGIETTYSNK